MKNILKLAAAVIVLTASFVSPVSAEVSMAELCRNVIYATGSESNINVSEKNGVVTLTGYYRDASAQNSVIRAARKTPGVIKVINLATQSN